MGIQINGQTDIISAVDGGLAIQGASGNVTGNVNSTGVSTFSGGIIVSAGSTVAPSISPTGDSNTGIFFPAPDTVAIAEGGVEALRIDSSANLLIGGTSSIGKVVVSTGFTSSNITTLGNFPTNSRILIDPGNPQLSNSQVFFGTGFASLGSGLNSGLGFIRENSGHWGTALTFYTHSTSTSVIDELLERVRIDSSGNLGIGTNSSFAKTHIEINASAGAGSGGAAALWLRNSNQTANNSATIFAGNNSSQASAAINFIHQNYSTNAGAITFDTRTDSSTYAERMRIDSSGRVTMPYQSAFYILHSSASGINDQNTTVILNSPQINRGSAYSTSTGRYTCPVAGLYQFFFGTIKSDNGVVPDGRVSRFRIRKNGSNVSTELRLSENGGYGESASMVCLVECVANDFIDVYITDTGGWYGNTYAHFGGFLIG